MKKNSNWLVPLLLAVFAAALRLVPIFPDRFAFMFDHAKDSLIMMQMGTTFKPSLIGAATSIPGVYYGPLWYYLALPLNVLMGYHPLASVLTVIVLSVISVLLIYKTVGLLPAVWYAVSSGLIGTQNSAWSPYLTPFVVLPVLLILLKQKIKKPITTLHLGLLTLLTSLCFHFQPAYAVVLTPLVVISLLQLKTKITLQQFLIALVVFVIPFTPHLIFELRHDWHQTKQVVSFIKNYRQQSHQVQPNKSGFGRVTEINSYMLDTLGKSVSPIEVPFVSMGTAIVIMMLGILVWKIRFEKKRWRQVRLSTQEWIIYGTLVIGTFLLYLFLPAKSYYFVALMPVFVLLMARFVEQQFKKYVPLITVGLVLLGVWQAYRNYSSFQTFAQTDSFLFAPKQAAVAKVLELAQGKPFYSYQFVPEIYDYTYQHLYRVMGRRGKMLPIEFAYAPGEKEYMVQVVPELVKSATTTQNATVFLIVEKPVYNWAFDEWWQRVGAPLDIRNTYQINDAITVYEAEQKSQE